MWFINAFFFTPRKSVDLSIFLPMLLLTHLVKLEVLKTTVSFLALEICSLGSRLLLEIFPMRLGPKPNYQKKN